ncbi:hypothetical protein GCM10010436_06050 [Paractinoplanes durhamensis]
MVIRVGLAVSAGAEADGRVLGAAVALGTGETGAAVAVAAG